MIIGTNLLLLISIGTSETLGRGSVQYMSAGTGIQHSEMNNNDDLYVIDSLYNEFDVLEFDNGIKNYYHYRT